MKNISAAFNQLICGTCERANKYIGERKNENGIRNSFIVDLDTIRIKVTDVKVRWVSAHMVGIVPRSQRPQ